MDCLNGAGNLTRKVRYVVEGWVLSSKRTLTQDLTDSNKTKVVTQKGLLVDIENEGVAIVVSPTKGEICPLDLSGLRRLTMSLKHWKTQNIGCLLLLKDGMLFEISNAQISESTLLKTLLSSLPFTEFLLDLELVPSSISIRDFKEVIAAGVEDQIKHFGSDREMTWSVLKPPADATVDRVFASGSFVEIADTLDFPPLTECLPHL